MLSFLYLHLLLSLFLSPLFVQPEDFFFDGFDKDHSIILYGTANRIGKGIVQLTDDASNVTGHLFWNSPISFKDPQNGGVRSFSTAFTFAIVPAVSDPGGHGLAFTVTPTGYPYWNTLPEQYMGLFNTSNMMGDPSNHLFAVEFDTVYSPEFQDIDGNHVGIDLNSLVSNFSESARYLDENGKNVSLNLKSGKTIQAWIDFDSVTSTLNVSISPSGSKPNLPLLSHKVNLSLILEDSMSVGFSCSTGFLISSHYLLGWSFNMSSPALSLPMKNVPPTSKGHVSLPLVLSVSLSSLVLIAGSLYLIKWMRDADVIEAWEKTIGPHRYSYKELKIATKGFSDKELLGRGGFGRVYRGVMPKTKTLVAVKRVSQESRQGLHEFMAEIATTGCVRHRNVAQLLGWCRRHNDLMLVYDYMPNGSLDRYLFNNSVLVLTWEQRLNIIKGVASGLFYLHEGWEQVVIHRDIKSSNVLLDSELNGRLGDFGLAKLHDHGANLVTTKVMGTLGYLAPELSKTGKATKCTDVFAFGVLLLEVVCGRRPVEPRAPQEEVVLVEWAWDKWVEGSIASVVDPRLGEDFDQEEVTMVLKLGLMCSFDAPLGRPNMRQVVSYLTGEMEMPEVLEPLNVDGSMGFSHSFRTSEFEVMSKGEVYSIDVDEEHISSPTPLLISSDKITSAGAISSISRHRT